MNQAQSTKLQLFGPGSLGQCAEEKGTLTKLNSNGSSMGNPGRVGEGGIIWDSNGDWVSGYARAIGHTTNVATELWALRDGINLCIDLNLEMF